MAFLLALDYDGVSLNYLKEELQRLNRKFPGYTTVVYQSSKDCYHIRFIEGMTWEQAIKILNYSDCSKKYKDFCKRVKMFPIRIAPKIRFFKGDLEIKPKPELIQLHPSPL